MISNIKFDIIVILTLQCIGIGLSLPYPVFGTKRYHRANVISPVIAPVPVYTSVPQYYDSQNYDPYPYAPGSYSDDSNYFYYPQRHEPVRSNYRAYGMPTYHGEYKPTPYYYAHGPTYSYYDDHIESANPLDDLHEEMLQEDERERQRDLLPVGQETWYENSQMPDSLANANAAFLRNLIAYNKQLNAVKEEPVETSDEFEDYMNDEGIYDSPSEMMYNNNNNNNDNYNYNNYNEQIPNQRINEIDDDDVRALKLLASKNSHQQHQLQQKQQQQQQPHEQQQLYFNQRQQTQHHQQPEQHEQQLEDAQSSWQQQNSPSSSLQQYDADPEYDDSWINWDRKRSTQNKKDLSIFTFTDRKPHIQKQPPQQILTTHIPIFTRPTATSIIKTQKHIASTHIPIIEDLEASLKKLPGQKEVVLPRPANPTRRPFNLPIQETPSEEDKRTSKDSVYDTIKQLLALEHHHEKNPTPVEIQRLQKRYIANEESLVQELNGLKRLSV